MVKYFLYRLAYELFNQLDLNQLKSVEIDYMTEDVADGDLLIIFISKTMKILGVFEKQGDKLVPKKYVKSGSDMVALSEFYDMLSFVTHINERTYKLFAKKVKEISQADFNILRNSI